MRKNLLYIFLASWLFLFNSSASGSVSLVYDADNASSTESIDTAINGLNDNDEALAAEVNIIDGNVTSIDAKLDGIEDNATADQTANETLTAIKTVDGSGSGLDADTVDGSNPGTAFTRDAEDNMTDGSNLPDGHAIKVYGDANWAGGYSNLTQFVAQTAWRIFYSNTDGNVTELALGANGTYLRSSGATAPPSFSTPSGAGDVTGPGSNTDEYVPQWDGADSKALKNGFVITAAGKAIIDDANTTVQRATLDVEEGATKYPDAGEQAFLDADHTKLDGIEAAADVTDATNVAAAGAVMDSDFTAAEEIMVSTGAGTHNQITLAASNLIGRKAAGSTVALDAADIRPITGETARASDYADLATAISTIGATDTTLIIDSSESLSDNATFPSNLSVEILKEGLITVASNSTLTISGPFKAGIYKVFSGSQIPVEFGNGMAVQVEWFGLTDNATTDNTAAIESARDSLPSEGGILQFGGTTSGYRIKDLSLDPLITVRGIGGGTARTTSALIASGYTPQFTTFVVKTGDEGWIIDASEGFNRLEDFRVIGESGAEIGIDIKSADVHTSNISVCGFLNGIGVKMANTIRSHHNNLNIQGCGLGLYLAGINHCSVFDNMTVENCTVGIYGTAAGYAITFNSLTAEGLEKGKLSTSFPSTGLLTVAAQILTDLGGISQADFEGGVILIGTSAVFNGLYMEGVSTTMLHAALDSHFTVIDSYLNDQVGPPTNAPRNFVNAKRARGVVFLGGTVSTSDTRGNALFDIVSSRGNFFYGYTAYHTDSSVYTGTAFEDTASGTVNYCYRSLLKSTSDNPFGLRFDNLALTSQNVISSSNAISIDCLSGGVVYVNTLSENTTITSTNERDGQYLEVHVFQDATGSRTVAWNAKFKHSWSDTGNAASKNSAITFRYKSSDSKWHQIGEQVTYH